MRKFYLSVGILLVGIIGLFYFITNMNQKSNAHQFYYETRFGGTGHGQARIQYDKMRKENPETGQIPNRIYSKELEYAKGLPIAKNISYKKDNWIQRGPHNIGGRTRAIAIDIANSKTIIAGAVSGGVYRSEDAGKTWVKTTNASQLHSVTSIVQDIRAGKNNIWYYSTGEFYGNSADYSGDGIFKSTDNGKTWKALNSINQPQTFRHLNNSYRLVIDHTRNDSDILYLASFGAILRSNDGGVNWKTVLGSENMPSTLYNAGSEVIITPSGALYATLSATASKDKGIFRSVDGLHWTNITPQTFTGNYGRIVLTHYPANDSFIYMLAHTPGGGKESINAREDGDAKEKNSLWLYKYGGADGSDSLSVWEDRSANIPTLYQSDGYAWGDFFAQGGYNLCIKVHPTNIDFVIIGGTNLYRSTDGFTSEANTTWIGGYAQAKDRFEALLKGLVYPNHHPDQHDILFHPTNPKILYSASDGGVAVTDDCTAAEVTWESLNNGYYTTQFYTTSINANPNPKHAMSNVIIGGFQDNESQFTYANSSQTAGWERISCCDGAYSSVFDDEDYTWITTSKQLGGMFLFKYDADGNEKGIARLDPDGGVNYLFINPYIHDVQKPEVIYLAAGNFIWKNSNIKELDLNYENTKASTNWLRMRDARTSTSGNSISALAVTNSDNPTLYFGSTQGDFYKVENVQDDENYITTHLTANAKFNNGYISSIAIDPKNSSHILVSFSIYEVQSLFFTKDAGETWQSVGGNIEENPDGSGAGPSCNKVLIAYKDEWTPVYMVGTTTGLYATSSLNGDNTIWSREAEESIGMCSVTDIAYRSSDDFLFVGTHGCGSFSSNLSALVSVAETAALSVELFPNPVQNILHIKFESETKKRISVYDLSGKLLINKQLNDKYADIQVDHLAPGKYLIQIVDEDQNTTSTSFIKH